MVKRTQKRNAFRPWLLLPVLALIVFLFTPPGKILVRMMVGGGDDNGEPAKVSAIGIPLPDGYSVFGIDVSHYQADIDWKRVSSFQSGPFQVNFAFIKATEGGSRKDPRFQKNWKDAKANGVPRGAYHYFKPSRDAASQAAFFCKTVVVSKGDLPPVLDVEEIPRGMSSRKLLESVLVWLRIVEKHFGVKPIIYTGADFYQQHFDGTAVDQYPLWIAHYYENKPSARSNWKFWQFSDKASIDGISGPVDVNVFSGSSDELVLMQFD